MPKSSAQALHRLHLESPYPVIKTAWQAGLDLLKPTESQLERGLTLHLEHPAIDNFGFLPMVYHEACLPLLQAMREEGMGAREFAFEYSVLRRRMALDYSEGLDEYLYALAATGLAGTVLTVAEGKSRDEDLKLLAQYQGSLRKARKGASQVGSVEEFQEARKAGRAGVFFSVNGPPVVGALRDPREEFQWLQTWHDLGVRSMHLTYNRRNCIGDGCSESSDAGLSDLGRDLVAEMNRLGIIVDVPHSGNQTSLDACLASSRPVMASHTGRKKFHDHMRNKTDEVLKAIAETGGVVGVVFLPSILGREKNLIAALDAVDDMVSLLGVEHVAMATDYSYKSPGPDEFNHGSLPAGKFKSAWWGNTQGRGGGAATADHFAGSLAWTNWPLFTTGLVMRGYSDADIAKILGGNFLRVLHDNVCQPRACELNRP